MNNIYDNYHHLFDGYLEKIKTSTVNKFGSLATLHAFLHHLPEQGSILLAAKAAEGLKLSPPEIAKLAGSDKYFGKCIDLGKAYAAEIVEAVLYERAINGYEELTYNKEGECIARKKKYCSKSLLEYLKANSIKYQPHGKKLEDFKATAKSKKMKEEEQTGEHDPQVMPNFKIESYEEKAG
jgi:hypothetical protein